MTRQRSFLARLGGQPCDEEIQIAILAGFNLDEICLKADLIEKTRELRFPEFSGDGEYLVHYTIDNLVRTTGQPQDDANNTFTARLLLLLESQPVIEESVYKAAIGAAIAQYWRDYEDHNKEFVPGFLANDILRLWRTFCVNYEARTSDVPEARKNKRRLKNYKLKFSRMLTCYSALLYLLATYNEARTVKSGRRHRNGFKDTDGAPGVAAEAVEARSRTPACIRTTGTV